MLAPHSCVAPSRFSSMLKSRSQNSSSDLDVEPTVPRTTWRPRGDHLMVLLVRLGREPREGLRNTAQTKDETGLTEKLDVALAADELVEADVGLDGDTRARVAEVRVGARNDRKAFTLGLPREVGDSIYRAEAGQ